MRFLDTVHRVIDLARQTNDYYDMELPKHHPDYPLIRRGEVGPPPPPSQAELAALMGTLPSESIYRLMVLMYLGRGDMSGNDLQGMQRELKKNFPKTKQAIDHMLFKGPLAKYLSDGLRVTASQTTSAEHLPLKQG